ncbi:MAG: hypothetical protein RL748_2081 [Pseudomonadota bacterium]|jgi:anti-sigma-K factor RskA
MKIQHKPALIEKLAAEYVLGTLKGGARRRFETWMTQYAVLRRSVAEWQDRVQPLAELVSPVAPPLHVWRNIERELSGSQQHLSLWQGLLQNARFWRNFGLTSAVVAVFSLTLVLQPPVAPPLTSYVATLSNDQAQTVAVVSADANKRQLLVKLIGGQSLTPQQSLQLWAVPKQGNPVSMGVLAMEGAANGQLVLPLPDNVTPQTIPLLAISLEPKGGSRNPNGPSGPILYKGAWVSL